MGTYLYNFNILAKITYKQDNHIATLQSAMKVVIKAGEQLNIFEIRADSTICAEDLYMVTNCL